MNEGKNNRGNYKEEGNEMGKGVGSVRKGKELKQRKLRDKFKNKTIMCPVWYWNLLHKVRLHHQAEGELHRRQHWIHQHCNQWSCNHNSHGQWHQETVEFHATRSRLSSRLNHAKFSAVSQTTPLTWWNWWEILTRTGRRSPRQQQWRAGKSHQICKKRRTRLWLVLAMMSLTLTRVLSCLMTSSTILSRCLCLTHHMVDVCKLYRKVFHCHLCLHHNSLLYHTTPEDSLCLLWFVMSGIQSTCFYLDTRYKKGFNFKNNLKSSFNLFFIFSNNKILVLHCLSCKWRIVLKKHILLDKYWYRIIQVFCIHVEVSAEREDPDQT